MKRLFLLICLVCLWPISSYAVLPTSYDPSDSGFASNTVIALEGHNGGIWLATSRGANVTTDSGFTWVLLQNATGMVSTNVSALHSQSGRMWISTSHEERIGEVNESISDGLLYSEDDGTSWTQVNFGEDGLNIPYVWGGFQTVFDITGYYDQLSEDNWLFFAAFAGGLVASRDNGESWRRIYPSAGDSVQFNDEYQQPSLRNRYFSAVADSSHNDTIMLWTGTAGGILQYIYATPSEKLYASEIRAIAGCDLCSDSSTNYLYLGTDKGVSRVLKTGGSFVTPDTANGLVTALYDFREVLFVGFADSILVDTIMTLSSAGLSISTDYGESFVPSGPVEITGIDKNISSFLSIGERLYMAAETAGLFVTHDTGITWQKILIDSADIESPFNSVYDMDVISDTLYVGTDSGVVRLNLATDGTILSQVSYFYPEDAWSSQGIRALEVHQYVDTSGAVDSTDIWTVNVPPEWVGEGVYSVIRGSMLDEPLIDTIDTVIDTTYMIQYDYLPDLFSHDLGFIGDTLYVVGDYGIRSNSVPNSENIVDGPGVTVSLVDSSSGAYLLYDAVYVMENLDGQAVFGTSSSVAVQKDSTHNYRITKGNIDPLGRDVAINHTFLNSITIENDILYAGLSGDFIPALGVQYMSSGPAWIWASGRPVSNGWSGISVGQYEPDTLFGGTRLRWYNVNSEDYAWNFAFDGDSITYAATNSGLLKNRHLGDTSSVWDTVVIVSDSGVELLGAGTPVFSVMVQDDNLWIGTSEGTIRQSLADDSDHDLFIVVDSTTPDDEVYAYPVPFRPGRGEEVHFRFVLEQAANVTIEIYDFAMSLVARPIDGVAFPAGYYENPGSDRLTWDGYNGQGDLVSVGVYYFKVIYSTGEVRWGKLAVMP